MIRIYDETQEKIFFVQREAMSGFPKWLSAVGTIVSVVCLSFLSALPSSAKTNSDEQKKLNELIKGEWRSEVNSVRDKYRHPVETLTFFGVKPNSKVIELLPSGKAYYTEILAPYLRGSGELTVINVTGNPEDAGQKEKFAADPTRYDKVKVIEITPSSLNLGATNSADYFLTFRNVHNFTMHNDQAALFKEIFRVLKSGGKLGVVDHRAAAGKTIDEVRNTGYQPEAFVIEEAKKVGFKLVATSNINSNPKDTADYPKGVWTLPPELIEGAKDREKYNAIGESDRFTLLFVKP